MDNRVKTVNLEQVGKEEEMEVELVDMKIVKMVGLKNMVFITLANIIQVLEVVARKEIKEMAILIQKLQKKFLKIFKSRFHF